MFLRNPPARRQSLAPRSDDNDHRKPILDSAQIALIRHAAIWVIYEAD